MLNLADLYRANGMDAQALPLIEKAIRSAPGDPAAHHNLAQMALADGKVDLARGHYESILGTHRDFLPALQQLAMLEAREGNTAAMVTYLERAANAHPQALQPRLALARHSTGQEMATL